jgi:hypothetical protein
MKENTERGLLYATFAANAAQRTHCKRGHEYSGANLGFDADGYRFCRTCARDAEKRWKAENRKRVNTLQQIRRKNALVVPREPVYRDCPNCGTTFAIRRSDQFYCRNACMKTAWRKRNQPHPERTHP